LTEILGGGSTAKVHTDIWLARLLNEQGDAKAALDVLGCQVAPWEHDLSLDERGHLWTERAIALHAARHTGDACSFVEATIAELHGEGRTVPATLNNLLALLYCDLGRHEDSLSLLTQTLAESDPTDRALRIIILSHLAGVCGMLGLSDQALTYQAEATELQQ